MDALSNMLVSFLGQEYGGMVPHHEHRHPLSASRADGATNL